jgi:hypothetical protein
VDVTLEQFEWAMAVGVGIRRQMASISRPDNHGFHGDGWGVHIEGACGEMAVAKAVNVYWDGSVNSFRRPDLPGIQVKTRSEDFYDLIVRPCDDDDAAFVLVSGKSPSFTIHGWIRGAEAKQEAFLQTHGGRPPAYFVPKDRLRPIGELHGLHHKSSEVAT